MDDFCFIFKVVAEENQVYLEATVRQIFAQQMDKLFVLAALPPWPLLLGLAISFRVYAPVAHSVPPWPLLLGFLAACIPFNVRSFGFRVYHPLSLDNQHFLQHCKHHPSFYCGRPFSGQPFFGTVFSVLAAWGFSEPVIPFEA